MEARFRAGAAVEASGYYFRDQEGVAEQGGVLIEDFRPADLAAQYERGGAAALSVLTDCSFFQGSLADLQAARAACTLPVLRKDFIISEYQVFEAAAAGADAILLIAAILDPGEMCAWREMAREYGMAALVEVHDECDLKAAVESGAQLIGVNNRDLRSFHVSLEVSERLASQIPAAAIKVSESGIFGGDDVRKLAALGFEAFLVGEHLVKSPDPERALAELCS